MPLRLHPVLSDLDLPQAELWAARLDGELFQIGECFTPIDEIEQPAHRASVVHAGMSGRMIAEQLSAAWIWGAMPAAPAHHQLCVAMDARVGHEVPRSVTVREVVIDLHEVALVGGLRVTTPLRTVIDLARFSSTFTDLERHTVASLMQRFELGLDDCVVELNIRRNLPGKRRALERLSRC
ncbi:MAG: hypothetical protein H7226_06515 [Salinibacterium sp.]|nr:hypothetical protein [Salinibacterium sp.]